MKPLDIVISIIFFLLASGFIGYAIYFFVYINSSQYELDNRLRKYTRRDKHE